PDMPGPITGEGVARRQCAACEEEEQTVRAKRAGPPDAGISAAPGTVDEVLGAPGEPLGRGSRGFFEPRLGLDFGAVRMHTGERALHRSNGLYPWMPPRAGRHSGCSFGKLWSPRGSPRRRMEFQQDLGAAA